MDESNYSLADYYSLIKAEHEANNAWSAEQAVKAQEYQTEMSNTAHQREVADLKAAGLNPVLSAGGAGATTGSGVAASRSDENVTALYGLIKQSIDANVTQAKAMQNSAKYIAKAVNNNSMSDVGASIGNALTASGAIGKPDIAGDLEKSFNDREDIFNNVGWTILDSGANYLARKFGIPTNVVNKVLDTVKKYSPSPLVTSALLGSPLNAGVGLTALGALQASNLARDVAIGYIRTQNTNKTNNKAFKNVGNSFSNKLKNYLQK